MPKIEKDLLKVKGSDGQWHYVPAVGGSVNTAPHMGRDTEQAVLHARQQAGG